MTFNAAPKSNEQAPQRETSSEQESILDVTKQLNDLIKKAREKEEQLAIMTKSGDKFGLAREITAELNALAQEKTRLQHITAEADAKYMKSEKTPVAEITPVTGQEERDANRLERTRSTNNDRWTDAAGFDRDLRQGR